MNSLTQIDARIAELEKMLEAELAIEERISSRVADFFLKKSKVTAPESPSKDLLQRADETVELLQLQPDEARFFVNRVRALRLVNPCAIPMHSPTEYRCEFDSVFCSGWKILQGTTTDTSTACNTTTEFNIKAAAYGYNAPDNTPRTSKATVYAWAWFDFVPCYPNPTLVNIHPYFFNSGFYRIESAQYLSTVKLTLTARGYQYGYLWGSIDEVVLNTSGDINARLDLWKTLSFNMPAGADPFQVLAMAKLEATAKGKNTWAIADFRTQSNKIMVPCVNTMSI